VLRHRTIAVTLFILTGMAFGVPYLPGHLPVSAWTRLFGRDIAPPANAATISAPADGTDDEPDDLRIDRLPRSVALSTRAAPGTARTLRIGPVRLAVAGYWSWAMIDRRTGELAGSPNFGTRSDTASMIKTWIAADFLRRATERRQRVSTGQLHEMSVMIRDSDNRIASEFDEINGGAASIRRMSAKCRLTDTRADRAGYWSTTMMSARDAARLGVCLADGRAAGPQWTAWLLSEMRQVRGVGRFGIVQAFPADVARTISIKNGWIVRSDSKWHVNCLAVTAEWALAVMTVYAGKRGLEYGASICRHVAAQLGATG
jgi:hypothetical protein